jgi:hypothetical protein
MQQSTTNRAPVPPGDLDRHRAKVDEILSYAGLGLPAFPVSPRTKRPQVKGWQRKATDDGPKMYRYFAHFPDCNVGLLLGRAIRPKAYVFALDVDPRHQGEESLRRLLKDRRIRLPRTATAQTGGGGWHVLMTSPFSVKSKPNAFGPEYPGIDLKGVGGYIVAAPSLHPATGRQYQWLRHPCQGIAKAPNRLVQILPRWGPKPPPKVAPPEPAPPPPAREPEPKERPTVVPEASPARREAEPPRCPPTGERPGVVGNLTAELIARFPVPAVGHRWDLMRRAVGSLVGRGYGDELIRAVLRDWYEHFHELRRIRTAQPEADRELAACLQATRANPDFARSTGATDHAAACRAIELGADLTRRIRSGSFAPAASGPTGAAAGPSPELRAAGGGNRKIGKFVGNRKLGNFGKIRIGRAQRRRRPRIVRGSHCTPVAERSRVRSRRERSRSWRPWWSMCSTRSGPANSPATG